jgi:sugar lactone lactonase YvrE
LYFVNDDSGFKVRIVNPVNKTISTLAGNGWYGFANGPANIAKFGFLNGLTMDSFGTVYVFDWSNCCVRNVSSQTGETGTFAGNCTVCGFRDSSDGQPLFTRGIGLTIDSNNSVYVGDPDNHRIRRITKSGIVSTLVGSTYGMKDGPIDVALLNYPQDVAIDTLGNFYVADSRNCRVRKISFSGNVSTVAGSSVCAYRDGIGEDARFHNIQSITVDKDGIIFIIDVDVSRIRRIDKDRVVTTIAGTGAFGNNDGPGAISEFQRARFIRALDDGTLLISDYRSNRLRALIPESQCFNPTSLCYKQEFRCRTGKCFHTLCGNGLRGFTDGYRGNVRYNQWVLFI